MRSFCLLLVPSALKDWVTAEVYLPAMNYFVGNITEEFSVVSAKCNSLNDTHKIHCIIGEVIQPKRNGWTGAVVEAAFDFSEAATDFIGG